MTAFYTIGYEKRSLPDLIAILRSSDVRKVIDVRQYPHSRRREFSKLALAASLSQSDIDYTSLPELGTPQAIRREYKETGDLDCLLQEYSGYLEQLGSSRAADEATRLTPSRRRPHPLDYLAELVEQEICCLLCYERDHTQCHRDVLAERIRLMIGDQIRIYHL